MKAAILTKINTLNIRDEYYYDDFEKEINGKNALSYYLEKHKDIKTKLYADEILFLIEETNKIDCDSLSNILSIWSLKRQINWKKTGVKIKLNPDENKKIINKIFIHDEIDLFEIIATNFFDENLIEEIKVGIEKGMEQILKTSGDTLYAESYKRNLYNKRLPEYERAFDQIKIQIETNRNNIKNKKAPKL